MECESGKEWFLNTDNQVECRPGSGPSRTTDFAEIAGERCNGLDDAATCIECTKQGLNAWNWENKVCNNTIPANNALPVDVTDIKKNIERISGEISTISSKFGKSRWKTAAGNFNGARLASDSVAGVVLGTAGGLITSHIIKNNQIKGGFEDIQCVINGQVVSGYDDEFVVGIQ